MSIEYQASQFTVRSRATGTIVAGATVRVYEDIDGAKGALSTGLFDMAGDPIDQSTAPMETDVQGVVRFRHTPGVWFIEATDGSNVFERPGFAIGTAAQRDTGDAGSEVPTNATLGPAIVANVERGDMFQALTGIDKTEDQSGKILGVQFVGDESVANVYPFLSFLPSDTGNAGKVLRLNPLNSKLMEWASILDLLPDLASNAGKALVVNGTETGLEWVTVSGGGASYPPFTGNAGKPLVVNGTEDGVAWGDFPSELPAITAGDAGKVLAVNATEDGFEWIDPPAGGDGLITIDTAWSFFTFSRTATATDHNRILEPQSSSNLTFFLPDDAAEAIPVGTLITLVRRGTGALAVEVAGTATVNGGTDSYRITGQFGAASIYKRAADSWIITGQVELVV